MVIPGHVRRGAILGEIVEADNAANSNHDANEKDDADSELLHPADVELEKARDWEE